MKALLIGDMHVKANNIKESEALIDFILFEAEQRHIDRVVFLGDQYDSHSVIRSEVLKFWTNWLFVFSKRPFKTIVLQGNHEISGDYSDNFSALHTAFHLEGPNFKIVHEPYLDGIYGYLPYIHDNNKFIEEANKLAGQGATVLVSHPNFEGAVYDNGSPLSGGVPDNSLDPRFLHLIGGHIHCFLELGRIWYPGTPRWLTKSCANKQKGIWLVEHDETGLITQKEFISTQNVCTPILSYEHREGGTLPEFPSNADVNIELIGSSEWIRSTKEELRGTCKISTKITDIKKSKNRKSGNTLREFLLYHYQINDREGLLKYMGDLDLV